MKRDTPGLIALILWLALVSASSAQTPPLALTPLWQSGPSNPTVDFALLDVDADGDLDVVFANDGAPNTLYRNDGSVFTATAVWSSASNLSTGAIAAGDVDGDGLVDLVCGNYNESNALYINAGGTFTTTPTWLSGPANNTTSIVLGDVDGDGDLDLVCANADQGNTLYRNDGGVFTTQPVWQSDSTHTTADVALGDIDGDGNLDLVCANALQVNELYLNVGGTFAQTPAWSSSAADYTLELELGDINGDGLLDVVFGNWFGITGQPNTMHLNAGGAFSVTPDWISSVSDVTSGIALGDADGDGDLDLACGNTNHENSLYINDGGTFAATPAWQSTATQRTGGVAFGDIDGDGDLDLVCANRSQANAVYENVSAAFIDAPAWSSTPAYLTGGVELGDIDGDGDLDLVCINIAFTDGTVYENQGGAFTANPTASWGAGAAASGFVLEDIDGDGGLDAVVSSLAVSNRYYRNEGGAFSASPAWESTAGELSQYVAAGDIDADGDADLVFGNYYGAHTLYLNDSGTLPAVPDSTGPDTTVVTRIALGDVDGDGDLDLVCGNEKANMLFRFEGGAFTETPVWLSTPQNRTTDVALGDVDGDGDLDLVCANTPQTNTMYRNDGGTFTLDPTWSCDLTWSSSSVALGDVDGDGDLDAVFGNNFDNDNTLYLNVDGKLTSSPVWSVRETAQVGDIALGDVDEDGDLDFVVGRVNQPNLVYAGRKDPAYRGDPATPTNQRPNNAAHLRRVRTQRPPGNAVQLTFTAVDVESDPIWVVPHYQYRGAPDWFDMVVDGRTGRQGPFATTPAGSTYTVEWDLSTLPIDGRDVTIRLRVVESPRVVGVVAHAPSYLKEVGPVVPLRPQISTNASSIPFPVVTVGDTATFDLSVANTGNATLSVSDVASPGSEMRVVPPAPFDVAPGASRPLTVYLEPLQGPSPAGDVVIMSNDPASPATSIPVVADVRALEAQVKLLAQTPELPLGEAVTFVVTPLPDVRVEGGTLYARARGTTTFAHAVALTPYFEDFIAVVPGEGVTEAGIEYYVELVNSPVVTTEPHGAPADSIYSRDVASPLSVVATPLPNDGPDIVDGKPVVVHVSLPDGSRFASGTLYFRAGGSETYGEVELTGTGASAEGLIPAQVVGARGVEYWVDVTTLSTRLTDPATDPGASPRSLAVTVRDLQESAMHGAQRYRLFSFPLAMDGTITGALSDDVGPLEPTTARAYAYDTASGGYAEVPSDDISTLELGRAYWLITKNPHRLDTGPTKGHTTPLDRSHELTLAPGWNLVGDPFAFAVPWDSFVVDTTAMSEAEGNAVAAPVRWDGDHYEFDARVLEPFEGYWVENLGNDPVTLRVPPRTVRDSVAATAAPRDEPGQGWRVGVEAEAGGVTDADNYFGEERGASSARDRFDRSEPPVPPGRSMSLCFIVEGETASKRRCRVDVRGITQEDAASQGHVWRFDVSKDFVRDGGLDEVRLRFEGIGTIPEEMRAVLVDRELARSFDLAEHSTYAFFLATRWPVDEWADARFEVVVGTKAFTDEYEAAGPSRPLVTGLEQNVPNPFNPRTVVRYSVAEPTRVTINVYDVRGELVLVLEDRRREPGRYEVGWNGVNDRGEPVASGVYFYRMTAGRFTQTHKMVLIK